MTTVVKAKDPASFLRLVPVLAGFTPRQSIALVPFRRKRSAAVMRMDIPRASVTERLDGVPDFAEAAMALIERVPGADGVAIVVYTDDEAAHTPEGVVLPHDDLVEALRDAAEDHDLRLIEALCVTPGGWGDYLDGLPRLRPMPDAVTEAELGLEPAPNRRPESAGRVTSTRPVTVGDQHSGAALPDVGLAVKEQVGQALRHLETTLDRVQCGVAAPASDEHPHAIEMLELMDDLPAFFETVVTPSAEDPSPFRTAALIWSLNQPFLRDAALVQWARDLDTGALALAEQHLCAETGMRPLPEIAETFMGRGPRPDPERLSRALDRVRTAAASAPRAQRAAVLTSAAWLSWALGRSTHADHLLATAHDLDPELTLIGVLRSVLDRVGLPPWAFAAPQGA